MFHLPTRHPPNCGLPPTPRAIPAATQMPRLAFRHRILGVLIAKPPYHRTPLIKTRQMPFALVNPKIPPPSPSPHPKGTRAGLYGKGCTGKMKGESEGEEETPRRKNPNQPAIGALILQIHPRKPEFGAPPTQIPPLPAIMPSPLSPLRLRLRPFAPSPLRPPPGLPLQVSHS